MHKDRKDSLDSLDWLAHLEVPESLVGPDSVDSPVDKGSPGGLEERASSATRDPLDRLASPVFRVRPVSLETREVSASLELQDSPDCRAFVEQLGGLVRRARSDFPVQTVLRERPEIRDLSEMLDRPEWPDHPETVDSLDLLVSRETRVLKETLDDLVILDQLADKVRLQFTLLEEK